MLKTPFCIFQRYPFHLIERDLLGAGAGGGEEKKETNRETTLYLSLLPYCLHGVIAVAYFNTSPASCMFWPTLIFTWFSSLVYNTCALQSMYS